MKNAVHTVRSWGGTYYVPGLSGDQLRDVGRVIAGVFLCVALVYCGRIGWDVIQELRQVKLADLREVFWRVSVGDAILSWFGYVLVRDLFRSVLERTGWPP